MTRLHTCMKWPLALLVVSVLGGVRGSLAQESAEVSNVKLRFVETVSSASAKVGQVVALEVVESVEFKGRVIVAAGADASASVTTAKRRGHNRRDGQLVLTVQSVSAVDGKRLRLQSAAVREGTGHGQPIFGPCTFPFPADPVGLFRRGVNVVIPKGTELVAGITLAGP